MCLVSDCDEAGFSWKARAAPCYQAANKGSRNVQVAFRPYGGIASRISKVLGPNEVWTPQLAFDGCMNGYVGTYEASYSGNAKQGKAEMLFGPVAVPREVRRRR